MLVLFQQDSRAEQIFWNKQKYLSLYDFQTFGLIVKQYFFLLFISSEALQKKLLHFCQQKWKRNVNFRGRGNSQAQRSWSLHNVSWLIFLCHHSAHTEVKNRQLKQWGRSCGAPEKGISSESGWSFCLCLTGILLCHRSRFGASLWKCPGIQKKKKREKCAPDAQVRVHLQETRKTHLKI